MGRFSTSRRSRTTSTSVSGGGVDLPDEAGILEGTGEKMRHVKVTGLEDIQEDVLAGLVREAVALNRSKGDPTQGA